MKLLRRAGTIILFTLLASLFELQTAAAADVEVSTDPERGHVQMTVYQTQWTRSCVSEYAGPKGGHTFGMPLNSSSYDTLSAHLDVLRSVDGDELSKLFVLIPYFGLDDTFAMFLNGTYSEYAEGVLKEYGADGVLDDIEACSDYFSICPVVSGPSPSIVRAHLYDDSMCYDRNCDTKVSGWDEKQRRSLPRMCMSDPAQNECAQLQSQIELQFTQVPQQQLQLNKEKCQPQPHWNEFEHNPHIETASCWSG